MRSVNARRVLALTTLRASKVLRALTDRRSRDALLRHGVLASSEHRKAPLSDSYSTVVDVGASRGQFALHAARRWPNANIVCFEPLGSSADRLRSVLRGAVEVHQFGVGSVPGRMSLNVSGREDSSSILPIALQADEYPETKAVGVEEVDVTTLDDALGHAALGSECLLKIDVQGYELEVLKGGRSVLKSATSVLCECSFVELYDGQPLADEVIEFLREQGFRLIGFSGQTLGRSGRPIQADLIFERVHGE